LLKGGKIFKTLKGGAKRPITGKSKSFRRTTRLVQDKLLSWGERGKADHSRSLITQLMKWKGYRLYGRRSQAINELFYAVERVEIGRETGLLGKLILGVLDTKSGRRGSKPLHGGVRSTQ